jgi:hypothetical protein
VGIKFEGEPPFDLGVVQTVSAQVLDATVVLRVTVYRCAYSRADTTHRKSSRECGYRKELDLETLVWTRGRAFPLSRLEARLRCPRCGSRDIVCLFEPPASATAARA